MGWLLVPVLGVWLWDGPWLLILVLAETVWRVGFPYWGGSLLALQWGVAAALEWGFHRLLPKRPVARSRHRLLRESWVLLWLSLLLTPVPGLVAWQGTVGFDAAVRLQRFGQDMRKIVMVRGAKFVVALLWFVMLTRLRP
ncbi:MAG: hypothetical protein C7B44_02525 [Sulfobacillus thermosulfidooxidans]|uniref:Uncharacterized protein n=1 Tax=Sulfobacillus thermotolerans TaxID=338644 RepID=A0ABM6RQ20_9FIRM|nr:hypothetical protein [Sulfobacillus sp. hq2]AUW93469.1 hypothetical protein BXT84_05495 [Sulfobacillus thermotolerans]MCY0907496.1 hypothetical protein [Sulfobacillus thermotolerans]POB10708.1 hypothetical protein CO251_07755 [Sulfobacillus sp. hq2]PSR37684.1 MAG: hypothetical protein C7B44_02525 [Sulfobacillus thermosulfidooxidans]